MGCGESKSKNELKVVILGISGSGKSTFTKQMKFINTDGFEEQEITYYKQVLHRNVFIGLRELVKLAERLEIEFNDENGEYVEFLNDLSTNIFDEPVSAENLSSIVSLWEDEAMEQVWEQSKFYQTQMTNLGYIMSNIERFAEADFEPTAEDIFYARQRTTGTYSVSFEYDDYIWHIVDVGGQIPERIKWQQIIQDGCHAIIFFAALDEYNVISSEAADKTKLNIAREVFKQVIEDRHTNCVILFLNKIDLFEEKIKDKKHWKSFKKVFLEYEGKHKWQECAEHIRDTFLELVTEDQETVFTHYTCAIDTEKMGSVFQDITQHVLSQRLKGFGFM